MEIIKLKDIVIYVAENGKKVKFTKDKNMYSKIVVGYDDEREVVEVEANE